MNSPNMVIVSNLSDMGNSVPSYNPTSQRILYFENNFRYRSSNQVGYFANDTVCVSNAYQIPPITNTTNTTTSKTTTVVTQNYYNYNVCT
jgi:hypothetical protein